MSTVASKQRSGCRVSRADDLVEARSRITIPGPFSTMSDAFACLSDLSSNYGFDYFLLMSLPETDCAASMQNIRLSNLPPYVINDLVTADLLSKWSVTQHFKETSAPFQWDNSKGAGPFVDQERFADSAATNKFGEADRLIATQLGAKHAYCIPLVTRAHQRCIIVLFSYEHSCKNPNPTLLMNLQFFHEELETLFLSRTGETSGELSRREIECLSWVAAGKTSSEISTIVSLSEHTVNHYLNSCCKKLDCVNRTQAVASALRLRIIK